MNVIAMRVQQTIADVAPRSFNASPWSEELNRVTIRLRPSSVRLQRLVKAPTQVALPLDGRLVVVPSLLPTIKANTAHRVNVGGASDLMVSYNAGSEKDSDGILLRESRVACKPIEDPFKLVSKLTSDSRVFRWRRNPIASPGTDRN